MIVYRDISLNIYGIQCNSYEAHIILHALHQALESYKILKAQAEKENDIVAFRYYQALIDSLISALKLIDSKFVL